jgi:membrane protein implicated in regulation of membrane protease activity
MKAISIRDLRIAILQSKFREQKLTTAGSIFARIMLISGIALFIASVFGGDILPLSTFVLMGFTLLLILIVSTIMIWQSFERSKQEKMEKKINEHS